MVVTDPNQMCLEGVFEDGVSLADGLKSLEFPIELPDIFPARGDTKFPDFVLNPTDGLPFKGRNFSKTLLGIRHSALDLKTGRSGANC